MNKQKNDSKGLENLWKPLFQAFFSTIVQERAFSFCIKISRNIDPPYNTGNDFVYRDNFAQSREDYDEEAGVYDEDGERLFKNTETNGRFHSDWCSMMYPRLVLARNMLRDDGVIFISIDDNECHNLRKICDEVFGVENFVTEFAWEKKKKPSFLHKNIGKLNDYIICYVKNTLNSHPFSVYRLLFILSASE